MHTSNPKLTPFNIDISQNAIDDLRYRLQHMRWPVDANNENWQYGFNGEYLKDLTQSWLHDFDWRKVEATINAFPQFTAEVDGVTVHFIYVRATEPNGGASANFGAGTKPMPLILHHGWPSTFWDMHKIIEPLANPAKYGGNPADAFDVIVPSLPGFGFSSPLTQPCNPQLAADTLHTLMTKVLGYKRYAASGGDLGSRVTLQMGHKYADNLVGIHLLGATPIDMFHTERYWDITANFIPYDAPEHIRKTVLPTLTHAISHACVQTLEPQTLSYAMHDSPVGQLAWILQRWRDWGQTQGDIESAFDREFLLTTASLYWFSECFGTAARYYRDQILHKWQPSHNKKPRIVAPTGITFLGGECPMGLTVDNWVEHFKSTPAAADYNVQYAKAHTNGGHFGYVENPQACIDDIRAMFRDVS